MTRPDPCHCPACVLFDAALAARVSDEPPLPRPVSVAPPPLPGGRHTIDLLSPAYPALRSEGTAIVSNAVPQVRRS